LLRAGQTHGGKDTRRSDLARRRNIPMTMKQWVWAGATVGSLIGGYAPLLWGASAFSFTSLMLGFVGGIAGIWAGYKMSQRY
jgi:Zn-dependent protease with chaperone function